MTMLWLILTYTLPTEPSALRVGIWRKLKRTGALLHQDAFWILPASPRTREQFQWLTAEIVELGGRVSFWEAKLVMGIEEDTLVAQFQEQVESGYQSLLEQLDQGIDDLEQIARQYQQWLSKDYFHSEAGKRLRQKLLEARGGQP
jgi:hypothetical protein